MVSSWLASLPVAVTPLWQLEQFPLTNVWSKRVSHVFVVWHSSHSDVIVDVNGIWVGCIPVAITPLWQLLHEPVTEA